MQPAAPSSAAHDAPAETSPLRGAAAASALADAGGAARAAPSAPRRLLVLGGTVFLGRHVVAAALAQGWSVTVFNRGRKQVDFPGPVEALVGDRDGDVSALQGGAFDAIIDCSGYRPAQVDRVAGALGAALPFWVFVSSISVLAKFPPGMDYDEDAAVTGDTSGYGGEKARAEEAVWRATGPHGAAVVRPGLIVGPHDPTGRFSYWPWRIAQGGPVLAPGRPERLVQVIDARDLAAWCVHLAGARTAGTFHAVGPTVPMAALLAACTPPEVPPAPGAAPVSIHWVDDATLLAAEVAPWTGLPLWLPEADADFGGMLLGRNDRARAAGLRCRPLAQTVSDTLSSLHAEVAFNNVVTREREAQLLAGAGALS